MSPAPRLAPGLSQRLSLAPALTESLRLLAMPGFELARAIEAALEANVMLERVEPTPEPAPDSAAAVKDDLPHLAATFGWACLPDNDGMSDEAGAPEEEDLRRHLGAQLALERLSARDRSIAEVVIDALDEDGYLRVTNEALAETLADLTPPPGATEIEMIVHFVQRMAPAGVAARDARECLLLQLAERARETPGLDLAGKLVRDHFAELARANETALARLTGRDAIETRAALALIHDLDPHPGYRFDATRIEYLLPELIARRGARGWQVEINPAVTPRLRVNETYTSWLAAHRGSAGAEPLAAQLEEANALIASLDQREQTLIRVGKSLVATQAAFLDAGPPALVALTMREVAAQIGMHESTVSRTVQGKSIATPRGVIPLRHFFSAAVSNINGEETQAAGAVQARIRELIAGENPAAPLSDAALASALDASGVRVARRTVAKYREALGFASTRERRRPGRRKSQLPA
ncbi:MAG: RNA polymerase factor sigma-54 [Gammaproteobacteria bacterium]